MPGFFYDFFRNKKINGHLNKPLNEYVKENKLIIQIMKIKLFVLAALALTGLGSCAHNTGWSGSVAVDNYGDGGGYFVDEYYNGNPIY